MTAIADRIHIVFDDPVAGRESVCSGVDDDTRTGFLSATGDVDPLSFDAETVKPYFFPTDNPEIVHVVLGAVAVQDNVFAAATPEARAPTSVAVAV